MIRLDKSVNVYELLWVGVFEKNEITRPDGGSAFLLLDWMMIQKPLQYPSMKPKSTNLCGRYLSCYESQLLDTPIATR